MAVRISKTRVSLENISLYTSKSVNMASGATVNLAQATGNLVHITGTSGPITSFGSVPAGTMFTLVFDSTPVLAFNAVSMILNTGGTNYTCTQGDRAVLLSEGGGRWIVNIIKRDGTTIVGSAGGSTSGTIDVPSSMTLSALEDGKTLTVTSATDITITVPSGLPAGFGCAVFQSLTGAATLSPGGGVTILPSASGNTRTGGQNKICALVQIAANTYSLSGGTA